MCQSLYGRFNGKSVQESEVASQKPKDLAAGKKFVLNGSWGHLPKSGIVADKKPFFFHTDINSERQITIDLQNTSILEELVIQNRTDTCQDRASFLFYQLHTSEEIDRDKWVPLNIPEDFLTSRNTEFRTPLGRRRARYITIYSPAYTALHFSSVQVLGYGAVS